MRRVSIRRRSSIAFGVVLAAAAGASRVEAQGTSIAPSNAQAAMYRVVRSTSGSKGRVSGQTFVIEDPRTVFRVPDDRQVIVHFEWDGPGGAHRLEGLWRNPDGRVSTISEFEHTSRGGRFGAYWELALPTGAATGTWTLEARIDGQPASRPARTRSRSWPGPDRPRRSRPRRCGRRCPGRSSTGVSRRRRSPCRSSMRPGASA
jgi:hypothetical protein